MKNQVHPILQLAAALSIACSLPSFGEGSDTLELTSPKCTVRVTILESKQRSPMKRIRIEKIADAKLLQTYTTPESDNVSFVIEEDRQLIRISLDHSRIRGSGDETYDYEFDPVDFKLNFIRTRNAFYKDDRF